MPINWRCDVCMYQTTKKSSYLNHLNSKKHMNNVILSDEDYGTNSYGSESESPGSEPEPIGSESEPKSQSFSCRYCRKNILYKKNLLRHERNCDAKETFEDKTKLKKELMVEKGKKEQLRKRLKRQEEELEELKEVKEDYIELLKQIAVSKTKSNTINMYYIINNFDEAYNYEDLMKPVLTEQETKDLSKLDPLAGSIYMIQSRCIDGLDIKKRPIHCLDTARDKYLLRTEDRWVVDHKARKIFAKVSHHIYKHYLLDPTNKKNSIDKIIKNQQQLMNMEGKSGQRKLIKDLNDKVYIKNIKLEDDKLI